MIEHIDLIKKFAWTFHKTTGIEWNELFSEALLAYCEAINSYDNEKKTKESSWVFVCVQNKLKTFSRLILRSRNIPFINDWHTRSLATPNYEFFHTPLSFSKDVSLVILMVKKDPNRYNRVGLTDKAGVGNIRKDLRDKKKWTYLRVDKAMRDLRLELIK